MSFPRMLRLSQKFEGPELADVEQETRSQLAALELGNKIRPGESVAITAGSRGIANIASIIKAASRQLKDIGAEPFVVPAMGSHGGGTAEGQREILHSYGVTEEYTGAPIRSSMETVIVDTTPQGFPSISTAMPTRRTTSSSAAGSSPIPVSSVPSSRASTR